MKREIKFRAWIPTGAGTGDMVQPSTLQEMIYSKSNTFPMVMLKRIDFMQYTGLKDKDGKEIYEGDIVCTGKDNIGDPEPMIGKVIMREGSWLIENEKKQEAIELFSEITSREVIGNVWENPELMEEQHD